MNPLFIYAAIMLAGIAILAISLHITRPRNPIDTTNRVSKGKPLPTDFMTPAGKALRRQRAMDNLPRIYFSDKPKSETDPEAIRRAEADNLIILYNVKSMDDLADRFEENEREMLRRHKEARR